MLNQRDKSAFVGSLSQSQTELNALGEREGGELPWFLSIELKELRG